MPSFKFRALSADGEQVVGQIEAADATEAIDRLRERSLIPIEAQPTELKASVRGRAKPLHKQKQVTEALRELATLIDAAITVEQALEAVIETTHHKPIRLAFERVLDAVRSGSSLSSALEIEDRLFAPIDINLIRAGEVAGRLGIALDELATMRERRAEIDGKIKSALLYPVILTLIAAAAIIVLMVKVVPAFRVLFDGREQILPSVTQWIFKLSAWLGSFDLAGLAIGLAAILVLAQLRHLDTLQRVLGRGIYRLPGIGKFVRTRNSLQFCRALAALRTGGVTLTTALRLTQNSLTNTTARHALDQVIQQVEGGMPLADAVQRADIFDPMAERLIRVGERSGKLDPMLRKVAAIFEERLGSGILRLVAVIEPVLVLVIGVAVGTVVLSIMSAVVTLNELVL